MSHITPLTRAEGWDLTILERTCQENGWEFLRGQKNFKWYGSSSKGSCDHVIRVPGCRYEIGVKETNGQIDVMLDFFDSKLAEVVGEDGWKFKMEYDVAKAKTAADAHNHTYHEEVLPTGEKVLYVHQGQGGDWSGGSEAQWGGGSQW